MSSHENGALPPLLLEKDVHAFLKRTWRGDEVSSLFLTPKHFIAQHMRTGNQQYPVIVIHVMAQIFKSGDL